MPSIPDISTGLGELMKMRIFAYNNVDLADNHLSNIPGVANPYSALINPESYVVDIKYEFQGEQGHGATSSPMKFVRKDPEDMAFEFLFDNTGIIDGVPKPSIDEDITNFKKLLVEYDGDSHQPRYFKFAWGSSMFKGRCMQLTINYKLFNADGSAIRAICKVALKQAKEDELSALEANDQSPDLTHYRVVKKGDTLPLLCYNIYGDSSYYLQVARVNKLQNFRNLQTGASIFFPPFDKVNN